MRWIVRLLHFIATIHAAIGAETFVIPPGAVITGGNGGDGTVGGRGGDGGTGLVIGVAQNTATTTQPAIATSSVATVTSNFTLEPLIPCECKVTKDNCEARNVHIEIPIGFCFLWAGVGGTIVIIILSFLYCIHRMRRPPPPPSIDLPVPPRECDIEGGYDRI